jgi:hypothetical protein
MGVVVASFTLVDSPACFGCRLSTLVWLAQHAGLPGKGGESRGAFRNAAMKAFADRCNH